MHLCLSSSFDVEAPYIKITNRRYLLPHYLECLIDKLRMNGIAVHRSELLLRGLAPPSDRDPRMTLATDLRSEIMMPVLENDGLEVLAFTLDAEPDLVREIGACLTEDERRRVDGLAWERDRRRFVATRGRLRHLLASRLGIPPSDVELEYGPQGKPRLSRRMPVRELRFGVSRSEDLAVIALSNTREVGVDIEAVRPVAEADDIAALCFSNPEYVSYRALPPEDQLEGFLQRWTRLEAISKALGCGLGHSVPSDEGDWTVHTFVPKPGYVGTAVVQK
jgi:4'-phosphopantetheinyl transferase